NPDSRRMGSIFDKLEEKREEGVKIRILLAGDLDKNKKFMEKLKQKYDFTVRLYEGDRKMHVKAILVDDTHAYSGSANFTLTAFGRKSESTIYMKDEKIVKKLEENIDRLWEE
ncbi:MAG: phospholipase D family protein, partial [bacterium]